MHIVFITPEHPIQGKTGGIATYTQDVTRWLAAHGNEVDVVLVRRSAPIETVIDSGVRIHFVRPRRIKPRRILKYLGQVFHLHSLTEAYAGWNVVEDSVGAWQAVCWLAAFRPVDIVEVPDTGGLGFWPLLFSRRCSPIVVRSHGILEKSWMHKPWPGAEFQSALERLAVRRADFVLTASRERIVHFKDDLHLRSDNMDCVYSGVDVSQYASLRTMRMRMRPDNPGIVNVLYLGRIQYQKGVDVLIDALRIVFEHLANVKVTFVGTVADDVADLFWRFLAEWGHRATHSDWVPPEVTKEFLASADLIVLPSRHETLPRVLIEAQAAGVPQIGSSVNGIPEIIEDGVTGFVVALNVEQLAEKIIVVGSDSELRRRMARASIERAKRLFDLDSVMVQQMAIYEQVAARWRQHKRRR